jgi:catechol-2,3-dioxygenase
MAVSPVRLNHAVLFVADLDRAVRFYTDVFSMELVSREPRLKGAFLRLPRSGNHHDLGLFGVSGTVAQRGRSVGLYHLGWQLDTVDELVEIRQILLDAGAYTGESSHGATKSVYGADPDGNQFEMMWMLPRDQWGVYENAAVVERLDLAMDLETWSGTPTAGALVHESPLGSVARSTAPIAPKEN